MYKRSRKDPEEKGFNDLIIFYTQETELQEKYLENDSEEKSEHSHKSLRRDGVEGKKLNLSKDPFFESDRETPLPKAQQSGRSSHHKTTMSWSVGPSCPYMPVCKSDYSSLPQSSAALFLASFAESDTTSSEDQSLQEGSIISHYELGKLIGTGAFSECREGFDLQDPEKRRLSFKIVHQTDDENGVEHEIDIWRKLNHPGFLPIIDIIRSKPYTAIVCPLADKGNMLQYISKHGPFCIDAARKAFQDISLAIHYLHTDVGIIHRDIKLENILLDADLNPFICDFGLSEYIESTSFADDCTTDEDDLIMKGSFWYLPPEAIDKSVASKAKHAISQRCNDDGMGLRIAKTKSDIWSLGVVLYAMVSGHLPFSDDYLPRLQISIVNSQYAKLSDDVGADLVDLIDRILTVDIEQRPCINQVLKHPWLRLCE